MKSTVIIVGLISILVLLFLHPIDTDGDFYHHVNIGRDIISQRTLTSVDTLTFTAAGKTYVGNGWLSGVVFYLIYTKFGAYGINLLNYILVALTFFMIYWYLHRCLSVSKTNALLTILVTAPVVATRWPYRPEMFMYVFLFGLFFIEYYRKKRPVLAILFPVLTWVLVLFYGAGFPLVGGVLMLFGFAQLFRQKTEPVGWLYYASLCSSFPVALFFNGYGSKSILFIKLLPKWTYLWGDWVGLWDLILRPEIDFSRPIIVIYCIFTVYVLLFALKSVRRLKGIGIFSILALSVFFPFFAVRMRTFAAILCIPFIALVLSHAQSKWAAWITGILGVSMSLLFIITNPPGIGESTSIFPPDLISFMKTNSLKGRVFNTPRLGAFLSYHLAPEVQTFADTRDDLFIGTGALEAEQAFLSTNASVSFLLRKYKIDIVVVNLYDGKSFRDLLHDPGWSLVYFKNNYLIFVPKIVADQKHMPIRDSLDPYSEKRKMNTL